MRSLKYSTTLRVRVDLVGLARRFRTRLPDTERPYYDAYMSHLGRDDFMSATSVAEARANPQLWVDATPTQYKVIRQAYSVCEKVTCEGDILAQEAAWRKFLSYEAKCKRTNRKIRYLRLRPDRWASVSRSIFSYGKITEMRDLVAHLLGDFWSSYARIVKDVAFGPGMSLSSVDVHRTSIPFKLADEVTVTQSALPVWRDFMRFGGFISPERVEFRRDEDGLFRRVERVQIVPGCKITFVPKTSVIKRTIAIEPSANVMMQLAVHRHFARRLRMKAGVDITDQSKNRGMALRGSLDGSLATLDLSSASDSVSFEVVKLLLPKEWFALLNSLRSDSGVYRGRRLGLEKFSSMGNGFTFALETLIFYAIARTVCGREGADFLSVYGDDIICRTSDYSNLCAALKVLGFSVNHRKSFASGPFRESCGLDAFNGVDVRPVFVKSKDLSLVQAFAVHNHFYRRGYYDVCEDLIASTPEHLRVFGPPGPDAGFFFTEDPEKLRKSRKRCKDTQTYTYLSIIEEGKRVSWSERLLLESALFHGGVYSSGAPLRSVVKLVTVATHRDY